MDAQHYALANRSRTVFYTPDVLCRPKTLMDEIDHWQARIGICADEHLRTLDPVPLKPGRAAHLVELLVIDEAERLTPTALELLPEAFGVADVGCDQVVAQNADRVLNAAVHAGLVAWVSRESSTGGSTEGQTP